MTTLAENIPDELVRTEMVMMEEAELVYARGHSTINPDPTIYNLVASNNSRINLIFNVRSFAAEFVRFEINVYNANNVLVTRKAEDFSNTTGNYNYTYIWDTTNIDRYLAGEYKIVCTSYYYDGTEDIVSDTEMIGVTLEDYRLILDRQFVEILYNKVFGRAADVTGLESLSNKLYCGETSGATTLVGFFCSNEFIQKNTNG